MGGVVGEVKRLCYLCALFDCGGGCRRSNKGQSLGCMKKIEGNDKSCKLVIHCLCVVRYTNESCIRYLLC